MKKKMRLIYLLIISAIGVKCCVAHNDTCEIFSVAIKYMDSVTDSNDSFRYYVLDTVNENSCKTKLVDKDFFQYFDSSEIIRIFKRSNLADFRFKLNLCNLSDVKLLNFQLAKEVETKRGWDSLYHRFPKAKGVLSLGMPIISKKSKFAIVSATIISSSLEVTTLDILLIKVNGNWVVLKSRITSQS